MLNSKKHLPKIEVIYIASFSFSGSTLLDIILGGNKYLLSSGELHIFDINKKTYSEPGEGCTCGKDEWICPYWKEVRKQFSKYLNLHNVNYCLKMPKLINLNLILPSF